jgi:hypothetical protein
MITRIWHGRTSLEKAEDYLDFLLHNGTKEYLQTQGNLSLKIGLHKEMDCCHFWTITEWSDVKSIKAFAGEDYELAKYYPQDQDFLLEFEEKVIHFETYPVKHLP